MSKKEKLLTIRKIIYTTALQRVRLVILFLPTIVFFSVFILLSYTNEVIQKETPSFALSPRVFPHFHPSAYPEMRYALDTEKIANSLSAQGAIIMDSDSRIILFAKNPDTKFSMASTTKIMSALVALEYYRPDAVLTIQSTDVPPAIVGYQLGEKVTFSDMLYGLLLPSGNDAALALAQNYLGGSGAFIDAMNKKAKEFFLHDTHFSDSSGLDDTGDYSTVKDLARLASEAIKNSTFAKVVGTKQKQTTNAFHTKKYSLSNINELLGRYGVNGIKTGYTPIAGGILATSSVQNGHTIITVVMKSDDRFGDTEKLLSLLGGNLNFVSMSP